MVKWPQSNGYVDQLIQSFPNKSTDLAVKTLYNEAVVWKHLRHPHIVSFVGVSVYGGISLISEWMTHGTIMTFLGDHPKANRLKYVRVLCIQAAN